MDTRRQELGVLVRRERVRLDMKSQPALARAAGVSPRKVSDVERGEFAGPKTYDAIADALGWPEGSIQRYLAGGARPMRAVADGVDIPGLVLEWTPEEIERVQAMTWRAAIDEGAVVGKATGDPEREVEYLHDVYLIRRARKSAGEPVRGDAAP